METGISNLKDILELIIGFVGAGSLAYASYGYYLSKKQLNFAVIINCTERFQKIYPQLESEDKNERVKAAKLYIDLCNEELFYFKQKYLPEEIIVEWIDGMLHYLPHFKEGRNINENALKEIEEYDLLREYPRLKNAFKINKNFNRESFDLKNQNDRNELVAIVRKNLRSNEELYGIAVT